MKNFQSKVLAFIILTSLILFSTSYFSKNIIEIYPNFKSINILSEIISNTPKKIKNPNKKYKKENKVKSECTIYNDFEQYNNTNRIIGFNPKDEVVLDKFQNKLLALSQNKKVKIRIAWFGDSVIVGGFGYSTITRIIL